MQPKQKKKYYILKGTGFCVRTCCIVWVTKSYTGNKHGPWHSVACFAVVSSSSGILGTFARLCCEVSPFAVETAGLRNPIVKAFSELSELRPQVDQLVQAQFCTVCVSR